MPTAVERSKFLARNVTVRNQTLSVEPADGRLMSVPLAWFPRLVHATRKERNTWRLIAGCRGIHWPDLDEDISVANLLDGQPSAESRTSFKKWLSSEPRRVLGA